jgi:alpha-L-rhamnosidase
LLKIMQQFAVLSSNDKDVQTYAALYEDIKAAFNFKFYDATNGYYDNNSITSNLLPLYFGFVETKNQLKVANNILQKIKANNNHISTGVIGTQWLMRTLTGLGKADVAYTLASNKTYPSWGYMVENGATTIWELWNGNTADPKMNSQNHIMLLGDLLVWLNESIGGIKSDETDVAFKKVTMKPELVDGLSFAKASYHSLQGEIKSEWKREGNQFIWKIEVPANTTAKVCIPKSSPAMVMENGSPVLVNKLIKLIGKERDHSVFEIGSGSYLFTSTIK